MRSGIARFINNGPFAKSSSAFLSLAFASALVNILYLTSSLFMLQVYDRVIPSRSVPTLIVLSLLALMLFIFQGAFDALRSRMLVRVAGMIEQAIAGPAFWVVLKSPIRAKVTGDGLQPIRDLDQVKTFLSGPGPSAFFDLPWLPFYVLICFMFHAVIGYVAIAGVLLLGLIALLSHISTRNAALVAFEATNERQIFAQAAAQNAEVIHALGMTSNIIDTWEEYTKNSRHKSRCAADISNGYGAVSKVARQILQSAALAAGAFLVIKGTASPGIIIAGSILTARALAPVEASIAHWRGFISARHSWRQLLRLLDSLPDQTPKLSLPKPAYNLTVEHVTGGAPSSASFRPSVIDVNFSVAAGSAVGIIGPSASGKSSLARLLVGVWLPYKGRIRLDGADLRQWDDTGLGKHIGYLPQNVELFSGSVAQNIARFQAAASTTTIIAAAQAAGVHDLILHMPEGYETEIGASGAFLSAGQRQRIALARALYGDPFLVVLDEPNSNLDAEGEEALDAAIASVRGRGGIALVIAHRPAALNATDLVMMMDKGRISAFGNKEMVLNQVLKRRTTGATQLKVVSESAEGGAE